MAIWKPSSGCFSSTPRKISVNMPCWAGNSTTKMSVSGQIFSRSRYPSSNGSHSSRYCRTRSPKNPLIWSNRWVGMRSRIFGRERSESMCWIGFEDDDLLSTAWQDERPRSHQAITWAWCWRSVGYFILSMIRVICMRTTADCASLADKLVTWLCKLSGYNASIW